MTSIVSTSTFPDTGIPSSTRSSVRLNWWIKIATTNTSRSVTAPSMNGRVLTCKYWALLYSCLSIRIPSYLTSWPQILILFPLSFLLLQCSSSSKSLCNRLVMSEKSSLSEINIEAPENVENLSQLFRFCHLKAKLNKENCFFFISRQSQSLCRW